MVPVQSQELSDSPVPVRLRGSIVLLCTWTTGDSVQPSTFLKELTMTHRGALGAWGGSSVHKVPCECEPLTLLPQTHIKENQPLSVCSVSSATETEAACIHTSCVYSQVTPPSLQWFLLSLIRGWQAPCVQMGPSMPWRVTIPSLWQMNTACLSFLHPRQYTHPFGRTKLFVPTLPGPPRVPDSTLYRCGIPSGCEVLLSSLAMLRPPHSQVSNAPGSATFLA